MNDDNVFPIPAFPETQRRERHAQEVARVNRRAEAVRLRASGLTWQQVGERLGINAASACKLVGRELARDTHANVAAMRATENDKLDQAEAALWPAVLAGDVAAVAVWLKLSARRAKMNGLDAPAQHVVNLTTRTELDAKLEELAALVLGGDDE